MFDSWRAETFKSEMDEHYTAYRNSPPVESDDYIFVNDFLVVIVKQVQRHVASQYRKQ